MAKMGTPGCTEVWRTALDRLRKSIPFVLSISREDELEHARYTILHGMADPLIRTEFMCEAAGKPTIYPGSKIKELYDFIVSTSLGD